MVPVKQYNISRRRVGDHFQSVAEPVLLFSFSGKTFQKNTESFVPVRTKRQRACTGFIKHVP